ncbi:hypothetical protein ADU60_00010 [Vibrio coralliilyticus]|nr:hypothetical protein DVV14_02845 [Vibrio coralliilyticus]KPH26685.1 hypothetical protein ADU60_00010 [Vibrio coralliilyticus]
MKKRDAAFCIVIVVILVFIILFSQISEGRKEYFANVESLSVHSSYSAPSYALDFGVLPNGKLGAMYDCLTKFRPTSTRKAPKVNIGPSGSLKINVDAYRLSLGIHSGEVTSASLTKYDQKGEYEYSSGTVAVNCDIKLLNKFN